jgi:hypothetical protein
MSLRRFVLSSLAVLSTFVAAHPRRAQGATFEHRYGELDQMHFAFDLASVETCPAGGAVIVGRTGNGSPIEATLTRVGADGSLLWEKVYTLPGSPSLSLRSVVEVSDGSGFVAVGDRAGEIYLMKVDCDGERLWMYRYSRAGETPPVNRALTPTQVIEATIGPRGFIVTGGMGRFVEEMDAFVLRTDPAGAVLWTRTYDTGEGDEARAITEATARGYAGDLILAGRHLRTSSTGVEWRPLVVRVASNGTVRASRHGATSYENRGRLRSVIELQTPPRTGDLILTGELEPLGAPGSVLRRPIVMLHTRPDPRSLVLARQSALPGWIHTVADVREVLHPSAGAPAGTLAVAGTAFLNVPPHSWDRFLLFVGATDLRAFTARTYGDTRTDDSHVNAEFSAMATHADGFWLAGSVRDGTDTRASLISTNPDGHTGCSLSTPAHSAPVALSPRTPMLSVRSETWLATSVDVETTSRHTKEVVCGDLPPGTGRTW